MNITAQFHTVDNTPKTGHSWESRATRATNQLSRDNIRHAIDLILF